MSTGNLSFTTDRRSGAPSYFQMGYSGRASFSQIESLNYSISKEYDNLFGTSLDTEHKQILTNIIVQKIPTIHHNLPFLLTATYIITSWRSSGENGAIPISKEYFNDIFKKVLPFLKSKLIVKNVKDINKVNIQYQATLYRYCKYVEYNLDNYTN